MPFLFKRVNPALRRVIVGAFAAQFAAISGHNDATGKQYRYAVIPF